MLCSLKKCSKILDKETDQDKNGKWFKKCYNCRKKHYCKHNIIKYNCKECNGSALCEHKIQKAHCRECGNLYCEHNKRKDRCKICNGNNYCSHNKLKEYCKECNGSQICIHNKKKAFCKECNGTQICIHNRRKDYCKECKGTQICIHNKRIERCFECKENPSDFCIHKRRKEFCKECNGSQVCIHNRHKFNCKDCNLQLYLIKIQRDHIRRCFQYSTLNKKNKSIEYLGCSIEYFVKYFQDKIDLFNIDKKDQDKMTIYNIHIDHIKPISKFYLDEEDEFLKCCNYKNLQPLLIKDNLEKNSKWTITDEIYWNLKII
tara:strand:+ start:528 stop:1478 length:951 start_codon:yes stop_codon:yes gene_type:complete